MAMMQQSLSNEQLERLDAWLREHVPALGEGGLETGFVSGGSSNVVLRLTRAEGGRPLILRMAPANAPPASEKMIEREATVIRALGGSRVPHPRFYAYCSDA